MIPVQSNPSLQKVVRTPLEGGERIGHFLERKAMSIERRRIQRTERDFGGCGPHSLYTFSRLALVRIDDVDTPPVPKLQVHAARCILMVAGDHEPANTIAAVSFDGSREEVLVSGADFYSDPVISPDGRHFAWLEWRHPNMPWDGTELWVAQMNADGSLGDRRKVAGGRAESIFQPEWSPDVRLHFVSDRNGYWNLYRDGELSQLTSDHTFVQSLIDDGRITEEEARTHPNRNLILKALDGVHDVDPDLFTLELVEGDDDSEMTKINFGHLGYPVLQAADILAYKATKVPVGIDQVPHIELAREIARRFNHIYGAVFPEPEALLAEVPKIAGLDGRKMSKSYGNAVYLNDPLADVESKLGKMMTDPRRKRRTDPGDPKDCPAYQSLHRIYCTEEEKAEIDKGCKTATIGCLDCKKIMIRHVVADLAPIQERRRAIDANP